MKNTHHDTCVNHAGTPGGIKGKMILTNKPKTRTTPELESFYQTFKDELKSIFPKLYQKSKKRDFQTHSMKPYLNQTKTL